MLFNDSVVNKDYFAQNPNLTTEQIDLLYSTAGVDKDLLAHNPSINPLPLNKWQSGIFNWSW